MSTWLKVLIAFVVVWIIAWMVFFSLPEPPMKQPPYIVRGRSG